MVGDLVTTNSASWCSLWKFCRFHLWPTAPPPLLEGEALLEIELAYDEIGGAGIASRTEHRTFASPPCRMPPTCGSMNES